MVVVPNFVPSLPRRSTVIPCRDADASNLRKAKEITSPRRRDTAGPLLKPATRHCPASPKEPFGAKPPRRCLSRGRYNPQVEDLAPTIAAGSLAWALPIAALAGFLSFFSPCVIPLLPAYMAYTSGVSVDKIVSREAPQRKMVATSSAFVAGFALMFAAAGAAFSTVGHWAAASRGTIAFVTGAVLVLVGLALATQMSLPWARLRIPIRIPNWGPWGAPFLGAALALTWLPCTGPILGAIYSLAYQTGSGVRGATLLVAYAVGMGIPLILIASGWSKIMTTTSWVRAHQRGVSILTGCLVAAIGLLLMSSWWPLFVQKLQITALDWGFTGF